MDRSCLVLVVKTLIVQRRWQQLSAQAAVSASGFDAPELGALSNLRCSNLCQWVSADGCTGRSPNLKGLRRPFEVVTRSFLNNRPCVWQTSHPQSRTAWDRLPTKKEEAYESTYRDVLPDATETRSELITAYSEAGDASEAYWLTYRLLWAIPWSAPAGMTL